MLILSDLLLWNTHFLLMDTWEEGNINRPLLFNMLNYAYWKFQMQAFLWSLGDCVWFLFESGWTYPTTNLAKNTIIPSLWLNGLKRREINPNGIVRACMQSIKSSFHMSIKESKASILLKNIRISYIQYMWVSIW